MSEDRILLEHVHLHYLSVAYRERSLKSLVGGALSARQRPQVADIHALNDLSLSIRTGERVGLLGRNGAGKTTLQKAIAGLYPISGGRLEVSGSVRALFDLSLGFEPDATGRENILYRGLLLGRTPQDMRAREEEIVAFADLGTFIDYPLKTYSAGMQVRLAFAISTSIPGEILLLDEVIGAGDMAFMARAKTRIRELIGQAEVLVIASHDAQTLESLCSRVVWIDEGRVRFDGDPGTTIEQYRRAVMADATPAAAAR